MLPCLVREQEWWFTTRRFQDEIDHPIMGQNILRLYPHQSKLFLAQRRQKPATNLPKSRNNFLCPSLKQQRARRNSTSTMASEVRMRSQGPLTGIHLVGCLETGPARFLNPFQTQQAPEARQATGDNELLPSYMPL